MYTEEALSFAYKYPFSKEAKEIVSAPNKQENTQSPALLELGKARVEEALQNGKIEYKNIRYGKFDYLIGYVYARLLVSAMGNELALRKYIKAEAERAREVIEGSDEKEIGRLAKELNLDIKYDSEGFQIKFPLFLKYAPKTPDFSLTNFKLHRGFVMLDKHVLASIMARTIERELRNGLPIKRSEIPKNIVFYAKEIKAPKIDIKISTKGKDTGWIEKLLETPIPDVRHRVVNLILAPYLINVKGLDEEAAFQVISKYIERCKELDPNTKINDTYIRYQCRYAKRRGLKPLSLSRAKELLSTFLELSTEKDKVLK
jgi:hypothetical protein